jgi:hypothetical protein
MSLVHEFRAYCPVCRIQMRADRIIHHLESHHPELDADDLNAISMFVAYCAELRLVNDIRLELDLADLTFSVLPQRTVVPQAISRRSKCISVPVPLGDSLLPEAALMKCSQCGKLVFTSHVAIHAKVHESLGTKSFAKLKLLPKYAVASLPVGGWSVQGGAPGLGRRA